MKKYQFFVMLAAFVIAIGSSAFRLQHAAKNTRFVEDERWFAYLGGGENSPGNYFDLGTSIEPESEGCVEGAELCIIQIEASGSGTMVDPYLPDASALSNLQSAIDAAKTNEQNDDVNHVYVKTE